MAAKIAQFSIINIPPSKFKTSMNMLQFLLISAHGRVTCNGVTNYRGRQTFCPFGHSAPPGEGGAECLNLSFGMVKLLDREEIISNTRNCTIVLI